MLYLDTSSCHTNSILSLSRPVFSLCITSGPLPHPLTYTYIYVTYPFNNCVLCRSANRTLAVHYVTKGAFADALEPARRAHEAGSTDAIAAALYATILLTREGPIEIARGSKACEVAVSRLQRSGCGVPPALWNNAGMQVCVVVCTAAVYCVRKLNLSYYYSTRCC